MAAKSRAKRHNNKRELHLFKIGGFMEIAMSVSVAVTLISINVSLILIASQLKVIAEKMPRRGR